MSGFSLVVRVLMVVVVVIAALGKRSGKAGGKSERSAPPPRPVAPRMSGESAPIKAVRAQKHAQMARSGEWRAAKRRQDDAEQVHSIRMDTCESRLESLRVLYDAGILDREEYAERVARVKASHHAKNEA